jgi:predicted transcriptional regulator YdeE
VKKRLTRFLREERGNAAAVRSIERYTEEFDRRTGMGGIEVWIPIKA